MATQRGERPGHKTRDRTVVGPSMTTQRREGSNETFNEMGNEGEGEEAVKTR